MTDLIVCSIHLVPGPELPAGATRWAYIIRVEQTDMEGRHQSQCPGGRQCLFLHAGYLAPHSCLRRLHHCLVRAVAEEKATTMQESRAFGPAHLQNNSQVRRHSISPRSLI